MYSDQLFCLPIMTSSISLASFGGVRPDFESTNYYSENLVRLFLRYHGHLALYTKELLLNKRIEANLRIWPNFGLT